MMTYPSGGAGWIVRLDDIDDNFYFLLYDRKKKKVIDYTIHQRTDMQRRRHYI